MTKNARTADIGRTRDGAKGLWTLVVAAAVILSVASDAKAQPAPSAPPAVGVIKVERGPMTDSYEFNGRIEAINSVNIVARVTGFLEQILFTEGVDVKKGDLLYVLERAPFKAALDVQDAAIAQATAQLENSRTELWRKQQLVEKNFGTQEAVDTALATQRTLTAQVKAAQAQREIAQINLNYTEIRSPIDGRIGRTLVTVGNVVGPGSGILFGNVKGPDSGVLTTVVSQDPMYVMFPVPSRRAIELREEYSKGGGFDSVKIRLRLPDGRIYSQTGKIDFINNVLAQDTDTLTVRGVIPNPVLGAEKAGGVNLRELIADEFVTVLLESVKPRQVIAVPRAAVLSDQEGSYVYVVDERNIAHQRRVRLGQMTPETAAIADGLKEGEQVIVEGVQRARRNAPVAPAPATAAPRRSASQ
ncbi:MAG: efflux RND transporter periplasmic adaptor subunit [Alphaproteobacteria bacterium]|nr:efflux RND transporter periplasmic adaptor subunit [Alphaproteobacteria bacterium]